MHLENGIVGENFLNEKIDLSQRLTKAEFSCFYRFFLEMYEGNTIAF